MDPRYFQPIPCGAPLPLDNPHAFSVSMPTYQDVADYEDGVQAVLELIKTAYPRIEIHPYVKRAAEQLRRENGLPDGGASYILPSLWAAQHVAELSGTAPQIFESHPYALAYFPADSQDSPFDYYSFMRHCGYMIYSREAEDFLRSCGVELPEWREEYNENDPIDQILAVLHGGYGAGEISLCSSGMNAIYAVYAAIRETFPEERDIFIQYGWIYTDSISILQKCSGRFHQIGRVTDFTALVHFLVENGDRVAAVITETLSNPLLQAPDLPALAELAHRYGFMVVLDNTFATPWNVEVTAYSDVIIESLTKFASGRGDCMAGAIFIPPASRLPKTTAAALFPYLVPLGGRDLRRIGATIGGYCERVERVNHNASQLVTYLAQQPLVKSLHHAYADATGDIYRGIAVDETGYGGVISFVVEGEFAIFYDNLDIPKGPSLGCDFPLAMAYTLMAHWDMVNSPEGQDELEAMGISPWLIRLSVGEGEVAPVIAALEVAFAALAASAA
ncbi:MAG: hypothetical protein C0622_07595 [Desulfuromonas sp.]|nr:MAG: hypothetical protein C0622_07595 [Desulfuromonas sp.]